MIILRFRYKSKSISDPLRNELIVFLILLSLGTFIRLFLLGNYPVGLNQDEASAGYEAYSLLQSGTDRCGNRWPVLFVSWGSGQNALYSYLTIPFVALFGLSAFSTRIVSALFGIAALPVFYGYAKKAGGRKLAYLALFILTVNPWHIMLSRWALESNLLPFFLLLGIALFDRAQENPVCLIGAAVSFGLSLYCYGTSFFFLLFFGIFSFIFLLKHQINRKFVFLSAFIFFIFALPITVTQLINVLQLPQWTFLGVTFPRLTETRQAATTIFSSSTPLSEALKNWWGFCRILFTGSDGLIFNSFAPFGLFYFFGFSLALLGLIVLLFRCRQKKARRQDYFMLFALAAAAFCSFFISPNINRMNMAYFPILYLNAVGLDWLFVKCRAASVVTLSAYMLSFCMFLWTYFTTYPTQLSQTFFEGLGPALEYAATIPADREYVTNHVNMPYIFVLFYNKIPTEEFTSSVIYENPDGAFRFVKSFGKYFFEWDEPDSAGVYVIDRNELSQFDSRWLTVSFDQYYVLIPSSPVG